MEMGEKIRNLRIQKGLTLEELGNMVGVGKSTVRKWEKGIIANMKRDKILKVSEALGTSPAYLMGWNKDENTPAYLLGVENKASEATEPPFALSNKEKTVVLAYRAHPDMQNAVDRLLGCTDDSESGDSDDTVQVYMAARSKTGEYESAGYRTISREQLEKLQNAPEVKDGEI